MARYWDDDYYYGSYPYFTSFWWGAPSGWSDYDLYDYNNDCVATLSGEVTNPRTKPAAYLDAYWSAGVVDVVNNIKVKPRARKSQQSSQRKGGK